MSVDPPEFELTHELASNALHIPDYSDLPKDDILPEFASLREKVLTEQKIEVEKRRSSNPIPDEEELSAGAFREEIEPQCREAVFTMRRKGHDTWSSGFESRNNRQVLFGILKFDQPTVDLLKEHGYITYKVDFSSGLFIYFRPQSPDLAEITVKWNELADLLPNLGHPASPHTTSLKEFGEGFSGFTANRT